MYNTITGKRAIYYHTSWSNYGRNYQVKDIPENVIDIAYAFWDVKSDGSIITLDSWADIDKRYVANGVEPLDNWNDTNSNFYGNFGQFKKMLDKKRALNIMLSLGGWTNSKNFSDMVSKDVSRTNFVNNLINIFHKYPIFNGVSIDWEYLSNDGVNYGNVGNSVSKDDCANFIILLKWYYIILFNQ
jgi:chitinase